MTKGAITDLNALKEWFALQKKSPLWSLYRGARPSKSADRIHSNDDISDPDQSWDLLYEILSALNDGDYMVQVKANASTTNGNTMIFTKMGNGSSSPAISGAPVMPYLGGMNPQDYIQSELKKGMETFRLQQQVENLEAALEEKQRGGMLDRAINAILEHPKLDSIINGIGQIALAKFAPRAPMGAAVGVAGFESQDQVNPQDGEFYYEGDKMMASLDRIRVHFPDIYKFLEGLAVFIEANPEMAKAYFNSQTQK